ncbi:hypothetical protein [Streptomyces sp. TR06-5]|uniref:hypothetical protein n=1 Tax=unclassified Streptomyces TaxID=2593676 RepID=UPI00399F6433
MLALRLVRGATPSALLRRLLLAAAAAAATFLLLGTLGHATAHPGPAGDGPARLLWCLVPLATTLHLALTVVRSEISRRALNGLDAAGMGPSRMPLLAAASAAASCLVGSTVALLLFLLLRGHLTSLPFAGAASDVLGGGTGLPVGAVLLLFLLVPLSAAATCLVALRPRSLERGGKEGPRSAVAATAPSAADAPALADTPPTPTPAGLPWGAALTATGLAIGSIATRTSRQGAAGDTWLVPLPGTLHDTPPGVVAGWLLAAVGLVLAGPGLTHLCGRLIAFGRPGALRLLSGRVLQEDAEHIGRPVGVLCAVAAGTLTALQLYGGPAARQGTAAAEALTAEPVYGPLTLLGALLVMCCAAGSALAAAAESRAWRAPATTILLQLGAPRALLRRAAALRATVLLLALAPLAWVVGRLAALPLTG